MHGVPVEVVGVTSRTRARREAFAAEHGLRVFDTVAELIDAVDVLDVCTPPYAHAELAVQALERGRHVVIEKPFTGYYGTGKPSFRGSRSRSDDAAGGPGHLRSRPFSGSTRPCEDLLRRELGLRAGDPEGARDPGEERGSDPLDDRGGVAQRLAQPELRRLGRGRRRFPGRQGVPPADGCPLPEAGGRPSERRRSDQAGLGERTDARDHTAAAVPQARGSCAPTTSTSRITRSCMSSSRMGRSRTSSRPSSCSAASARGSRFAPTTTVRGAA